ncbi:MAG: methyltransferase [Chloroflexi bacterium]|nr:methyltransferase [Chloroflexota bacterium]
MPRSRDETLALLSGRPDSRVPVFSGLPSLTASGLATAGVRYGEAHTDPAKMAQAAASTFETFGFESAVVPFDLCVEAEALGCGVDFQTDVDAFLPPIVDSPLDVELALEQLSVPDDVSQVGRLPVVAEALRRLKAGVGREVAVGAWVPGPFTLGWQLFGTTDWLTSVKWDSDRLNSLLTRLEDFLARVAASYREAGADFITVHEMGGSSQVIGPNTFRALVKPSLTRLLARLPSPKVLSMCGDTNAILSDLAACGADALSVDQRADLSLARRALGPQAVLLGNFDPVAVLSQATPTRIAQTVTAIVNAGASAVWPGCDLWPEIPEDNFRALMEAAAPRA